MLAVNTVSSDDATHYYVLTHTRKFMNTKTTKIFNDSQSFNLFFCFLQMSTKYSENEESEAVSLLLGRRVTQNTLQETQIKVGKWVISSVWNPALWVETIQQSKRKVIVKTPAVVRATGVLKKN